MPSTSDIYPSVVLPELKVNLNAPQLPPIKKIAFVLTLPSLLKDIYILI